MLVHFSYLDEQKLRKISVNFTIPRSPGIREPHDDAVDEGAPLTEVRLEAVLGGVVVEAAEKELASLLTVVHGCWKITENGRSIMS